MKWASGRPRQGNTGSTASEPRGRGPRADRHCAEQWVGRVSPGGGAGQCWSQWAGQLVVRCRERSGRKALSAGRRMRPRGPRVPTGRDKLQREQPGRPGRGQGRAREGRSQGGRGGPADQGTRRRTSSPGHSAAGGAAQSAEDDKQGPRRPAAVRGRMLRGVSVARNSVVTPTASTQPQTHETGGRPTEHPNNRRQRCSRHGAANTVSQSAFGWAL